MKVSYFKKIEEGFFKDVYNQAFKGMSNDPKRDKKEIQNRTGPLFKTDFIKDLNADLAEALKNKAITIAPVTGSTTAQSQQQPQAAAPAQAQQQPQTAAPAQAQQQPQTAVQPTAQTRQDALQRVAQRKQQQKAQTKPAKTKPVDREEDLEGVAVLGYNENIKFDMLNTLLESIISEQQKLHQISNGIK
jgi:hypothetical protein